MRLKMQGFLMYMSILIFRKQHTLENVSLIYVHEDTNLHKNRGEL